MMINKKLMTGITCAIALLHQAPCSADGMLATASIGDRWSTPGDIYIALSAGSSYSTKASISASPTFWDPTPEGYNGNVGQSEVLGAGIGYVINPLLRFEVGADHRNSFEYSKYQSTPTSTTWGPRYRYFDLSNTTVMGTLFVNGSGISEHAFYQGSGFMIDPFIGAGIGGAFNTVDNLHSVQTAPSARAFSMMPAANTTRTFAYQFSAGFDVKTSQKLAVGVSYRYLNAGTFQSNNYIVDNSNNIGTTDGVAVPAWSGSLSTNEVFATLKYAMD